MDDHIDASMSSHSGSRVMTSQHEENPYYTGNQEKQYSSRFLSHGIEQIVDNLPRHNPTPQHTPLSSLPGSTIYQPHNLKDTSNEITFNFMTDNTKLNSVSTSGFSFINTLDRSYYPTRDVQGTGTVESLLNLPPASYSPLGLNSSKDFITVKNAKFQTIEGGMNCSNPGFHVKDTGLAMLSSLAHSRSPISEHAESKRAELINSAEEIRNVVPFANVSGLDNLKDSSTCTQFTVEEIIIKSTQSQNVLDQDRSVQNSTHFTVSDNHGNTTLGTERHVFDGRNTELRHFDDMNEGETITIALDTVPYNGTPAPNGMLYNPHITAGTSTDTDLDRATRNPAVCEEEKQVLKYQDVYNCGGCDLVFGTLCNLHFHLETHGSDGSYVFDRSTRTAYPRFGVVNVGIQTGDDSEDGLLLDSTRDQSDNTVEATLFEAGNNHHDCDVEIKIEDSFDKNYAEIEDMHIRQLSEETDISQVDEDRFEETENDLSDNGTPKLEKKSTLSSKSQSLKQTTSDLKRKSTKHKNSHDQVKQSKQGPKKSRGNSLKMNKSKMSGEKEKPSKSSVKKEVPCSMCKLTLPSKNKLQKHLETVHGIDKQYKCRTCPLNFDNSSDLKQHYKEKHANREHKCEICGKVVSTAASLRDHINFHMGVKPHDCDICGNKFRTTGQLNAHVRENHLSNFNQQCEYCGKTFTSRYRMREHTKQCLGIKPHKCNVCSKAFIRTTQLRVHMRTHTGERPFVCDVCGNSLTNYSSLLKHKRIHTGEKPFKCDQCQQAFSAKTTLVDHQRIHAQDKRFVCSFCGRSFIKNWNLKTHLRQHTGESPYKCKICGQGFKQNVLLKTHIQSHNKPTDAPPMSVQEPVVACQLTCVIPNGENHIQSHENKPAGALMSVTEPVLPCQLVQLLPNGNAEVYVPVQHEVIQGCT